MHQNLLIIDDEYDILRWLEELFKFNFEMEIGVYTAQNAVEALELLDSVKFDVVLTDIRMPGMDGITLHEKIRDNWPKCKTIFLTGFRNFDDIYKVVQNKDVRFILKSEEDDVITGVVREVLQELIQELEQEKLPRMSVEEVEKAKYLMSNNFMERVLDGKISEANEAEVNYGIPISFSESFLLFLIRFDEQKEISKLQENMLEYLEVVRELIQMNLPKDIRIYLHLDHQNMVWMFIQPSEGKKRVWQLLFTIAKNALEYAQEIFRKEKGFGFGSVVTSTPISVSEIVEMRVRQKQIMVGGLEDECGMIVHLEKYQTEYEKIDLPDGINRISDLKLYLGLGRRQEYFKVLSACCAEFSKNRSKHDVVALELYYSISMMLGSKEF